MGHRCRCLRGATARLVTLLVALAGLALLLLVECWQRVLPRLQRPWPMCCLWLYQRQLVVAVLVVALWLAQGWQRVLPQLLHLWLMCCLWLCQWQLVVAVLVVVLPLAQGWWQQALLVALPMLLPGQLAAALQQLLLLLLQQPLRVAALQEGP